MSMTRTHYIAIAATLRDRLNTTEGVGARVQIEAIAIDLADLFGDDNPHFDRDRFLSACGLKVTA